MRGGWWKTWGALAAPGILLMALDRGPVQADDNGFFGRLFRLGGGTSSSSGAAAFPAPASGSGRAGAAANRGETSQFGDIGTSGSGSGSFVPPSNSTARVPRATPASGPIISASEGPSTPDLSATQAQGVQPRLTPRARVSTAVTSADPLLTRMALGRSNDGSSFGMFLQVFADGTVIDSEGVHRVGSADLRPIVDAIQSGEITRVRGHCGTPSSDFIEYVHIVVFERRMGRLQAHSFSYAGNPQGCDNGIRSLHTAIENLQAKLSRPPGVAANTSSPTAAGSSAPVTTSPANSAPSSNASPGLNAPLLPNPATPASPASVIPLTPIPTR